MCYCIILRTSWGGVWTIFTHFYIDATSPHGIYCADAFFTRYIDYSSVKGF